MDIHGSVVKFEVSIQELAEVSTIPAKTCCSKQNYPATNIGSAPSIRWNHPFFLGGVESKGFDEKLVSGRLLHRCGECGQATSLAGP